MKIELEIEPVTYAPRVTLRLISGISTFETFFTAIEIEDFEALQDELSNALEKINEYCQERFKTKPGEQTHEN